MNQPLVSVVIPNYNYGRFLAEAVDSALAQTYKNIEIIVADDGSTDNSDEIVRGYGTRIRSFKQKNAGVSAVRNRAVSEARGELIAFLDSDDIWFPEKLEKQIPLFDDAEVGLVHCGCADFDNDGEILAEHLDGLSGWVAEDLLRYQRAVILGGGSAVVVRRAAIRRTGDFDTNLKIGEDWEFYYRVAKIYKVGFVPEILVKYRRHGSNNHANVKRMARDMIYAYDKIFAGGDELNSLKRECYGRIHTIIAGSSFRVGSYADFVRHGIKGVWLDPGGLRQFLGFPVRWAKRNLHVLAPRKPAKQRKTE